MQFMLFMIPMEHQKASPALKPDPGAIEDMTKLNELLQAAGVLKSVNGLTPPASGARIAFDGGRPTLAGDTIEARQIAGD